MTPTTTGWEFYDEVRHRGLGGNYMFLLKAFGNAPYYSGEAEAFAARFAVHKRHFACGMRTFMRRAFIDETDHKSHAGFAERWHHYKQQGADERKRLVWVPTGLPEDETMGQEGAAFRANEFALLVLPQPDGKEGHLAVERRMQADIMDYYDRLFGRALDWTLPLRSRLVGHGPGIVTDPPLEHRLEGGRQMGAAEFFSALEQQRR